MTSHERARGRLEADAALFKEAWIVAASWVGASDELAKGELTTADFTVPDFSGLTKKQLISYVDRIFEDFAIVAGRIVKLTSQAQLRRFAEFLRPLLTQAIHPTGPHKVCLAIEFEQRFGALLWRKGMEVPPYAELLMQGLQGLAVRHPEYMIARDLEFLYQLFRQAERVAASPAEIRRPKTLASENVQALARATIQTAFNLLESFVSGLARAHLMTNSDLSAGVRERLEDNHGSLRNRVVSIPQLITGKPTGLDVNKPPLSELFGEIKERRDSFVHCVPGEQANHRGYVKEQRFHDVAEPVLERTVLLTGQVIRAIWTHVTGETKGPRWLPEFDSPSIRSSRDLVLVAPH